MAPIKSNVAAGCASPIRARELRGCSMGWDGGRGKRVIRKARHNKPPRNAALASGASAAPSSSDIPAAREQNTIKQIAYRFGLDSPIATTARNTAHAKESIAERCTIGTQGEPDGESCSIYAFQAPGSAAFALAVTGNDQGATPRWGAARQTATESRFDQSPG